jgi:hypothetical protein
MAGEVVGEVIQVGYSIETAPRDGMVFLAFDYLGYPHIVWGDERGFFDEKDGTEFKGLELKWWAPIPMIPAS